MDIVYGNWNGPHRMYVQSRGADGSATFRDVAPPEMSTPSRIRTVIVADFDNDGWEEIFWNNIPGENRLFRKLPSDDGWTAINPGAALEPDGYGAPRGLQTWSRRGGPPAGSVCLSLQLRLPAPRLWIVC